MIIDTSDSTFCVCKGGVWISMEDVADNLGASGEERAKVVAWLTENIDGWNDFLMDSIVDFVADKAAEIVRDEMGA